MIEMSASLTSCFGYTPNDLLAYISELAEYRFFTADELSGKMKSLDRFTSSESGGYVFCIPTHGFEDRINNLSSRLLKDG